MLINFFLKIKVLLFRENSTTAKSLVIVESAKEKAFDKF
jgi:hypothetical protein